MKSGKAEQIEAFRKTARALGCDEDKEKFEAKLRKIAAQKQAGAASADKKNPKKTKKR